MDDLSDVDRLARSLAGSFHLVVAIDGWVRAQGSHSTACQIFHTRVGSLAVAANRPDSLARLTGAGMAEDVLAIHMLAPSAPYPLNERSVWQGVEALPLGHYLELAPGGQGRPVRWWRPPSPDVPLEEGADRVREALEQAVGARLVRGGTVSADLSGGLDSTSICFLAAPRAESFMTIHRESGDTGNDDRLWADRAVAAMPRAEHIVLPAQGVPPMFAGLSGPDSDAEAPFSRLHVREKIRHTARVISDGGSSVHMTGDGGDELFFASPAFIHTLARRRPLKAARKMRVDRAIFRWKLGATVREMLDNRSYGTWLAECARSLTDPLPKPFESPEIGWDASVRMPTWAAPAAVDAVRRMVAAASGSEPMSPLRSEHTALRGVRKGGEVIRRTGRVTSLYGISWQAPFLDDRVIDAALSIRIEDRAGSGGYKPALIRVMRGAVPEEILHRETKAEFSQSAYAGLRKNRGELLDLCDDMRLAELGLIDADAFRAAVLGLYPNSQGILFLLRTLSCEMWLRSLPGGKPSPEGKPITEGTPIIEGAP
ncbi:asparagine synthase-related protein [Actinomadura rudentiformis]|nr:asparagine synthase-related protein [Actinomadura rudentiformis]